MASELRHRLSVRLYQATKDNDIWHLLHGRKDDIFVYDRCGRLAYYIPFPKSYIRYRFVEAAILSTYENEPCGSCQTTTSTISTTVTESTTTESITEESTATDAEGSGLDEDEGLNTTTTATTSTTQSGSSKATTKKPRSNRTQLETTDKDASEETDQAVSTTPAPEQNTTLLSDQDEVIHTEIPVSNEQTFNSNTNSSEINLSTSVNRE